ncbi:rRNA processing/ribosome biogenesis-domain-containing protein [Tuber indicum]|nr:rRNA processing/ribosome biogenesis-domain-containing protein [Tuber indicum]
MPPPSGDNSAHAVITLRMINNVISEHTSPSTIPFMISQLYMTPVLETCASLSTSSKYTGDKSEASALLHRFKTRISSLLQSKSPTDKWTGMALAKAAMESSFECLASNGEVWVRLMVPALTKPEPPSTTNYAIATLTRVFTVLTVDKPALIRQIVSPNLPVTIGHILNILRPVNSSASDAMPSEDTLATALEALKDLLCHNPVTFRPFTQRTREVVLSVLSPQCGLSKLGRLAGDLFVSLHLSDTPPRGATGGIIANQGGGSLSGNKATAVAEGWTRAVKSVISEINELFNVILRCMDEGHRTGISRRDNSTEVSGVSNIGLSEWKGISKGFDRAEMLLRLLSRFLCHPTSSQVVIPLGQFVELTGRLAGITCEAAESNTGIERPERETVKVRLPSLKCCALNLLSSAIERLGRIFAPLANLVIEQLVVIYSEHRPDTGIRTAVYTLLTALLNLFGPALDEQTVSSIHPILSSLYADLVLNAEEPKNSLPAKPAGKRSNRNTGKQKEVHADSLLPSSSRLNSRPTWLRGLVSAAEELLVAVLGKLQPAYVRSQMRRLLERAAVFTANEKAMMASVLFPTTTPNGDQKGGSILPHLVGASRGNLSVEGIARPRLPVLWVGRGRLGEAEEEQEEDEEEEDEEEVVVNHKTNTIQSNTITEKLGAKRSASHGEDTAPSPKRRKSHTPTPSLLSPPTLEPDSVPTPVQESRPSQVVSTAHTTLNYTFLKTSQQTVPEDHSQSAPTPTAAAAAPLPSPATITITTTTTTTQHAEAIREKARLEAVDSDDEMIIPEIDMGVSSNDDDDDGDDGDESEEV